MYGGDRVLSEGTLDKAEHPLTLTLHYPAYIGFVHFPDAPSTVSTFNEQWSSNYMKEKNTNHGPDLWTV